MATVVDTLALINGLKPKVILDDGQEIRMNSHTTPTIWNVKRTGDHYACSCPGWLYQQNSPVDKRTCRHLQNLLGFNYEQARISQASSSASVTPPNSARKRPRAISVSSDSASDDDNTKTPKANKGTSSAPPSKRAKRGVNDSANRPPNSSSSTAPSNITVNVLLAQTYKEDSCDPKGWWISEKMDGVRAYYTNGGFYSRLGNKFYAPDSWSDDWKSKLPKDATLDGELFTKRNNFPDTVSIVRSGSSPRWPEVKYLVFDAPFMGNRPFEERLAFLKKIFGESDAPKYPNVQVVEHFKCKGKDHLMDMLEDLQNKGAEGLMLREPNSKYEYRRSSTLLKLKTFYDAEARVVAHHKGSGKNSQVMGAIEVEMECGVHFKIGSGFTDAQRRKPPKIGSIVVYKFQELSKSGKPRFPTYVGEAIDKTGPKDAVIRTIDPDADDE